MRQFLRNDLSKAVKILQRMYVHTFFVKLNHILLDRGGGPTLNIYELFEFCAKKKKIRGFFRNLRRKIAFLGQGALHLMATNFLKRQLFFRNSRFPFSMYKYYSKFCVLYHFLSFFVFFSVHFYYFWVNFGCFLRFGGNQEIQNCNVIVTSYDHFADLRWWTSNEISLDVLFVAQISLSSFLYL